MQDRPTAPELLDAMAGHLFAEVREWVPRERRFQILVLANLCAVLARELRAGTEPSKADLADFQALLGEDAQPAPSDPSELEAQVRGAAAELAGRIRAGEFDDELPATIGTLLAHVERKLEIARPDYDDEAP
jgi:hypothetical protein